MEGEIMSDTERTALWLVALFIIVSGALIYNVESRSERMAKAGYSPRYMTGDTTVYWFKIQPPPPDSGVMEAF